MHWVTYETLAWGETSSQFLGMHSTKDDLNWTKVHDGPVGRAYEQRFESKNGYERYEQGFASKNG